MSELSPYGPAGPQPTGPYADAQPYAARPFDPPTASYPSAPYPPAPNQPYNPYGPPGAPYGGWPPPNQPAPGGYAQYPPYQPYPVGNPGKNGMGVASLVLSIAGIVILPGLFIGSVLGVIFGHIGLAAVGRGEANNRGVALAGVIIGYIGLAISILIWGLVFAIGGAGLWYYASGAAPDLAAAVFPAV